jgi:hypothetical protein
MPRHRPGRRISRTQRRDREWIFVLILALLVAALLLVALWTSKL